MVKQQEAEEEEGLVEGCISAVYRLYLGCISAVSRLYLGYGCISAISHEAEEEEGLVEGVTAEQQRDPAARACVSQLITFQLSTGNL